MENDTVYSEGNFDPQYPAPPRIHWSVLLIGFVLTLAGFAIANTYEPQYFHDWLYAIFFNLWGLYIVLWLRQLNKSSIIPFWFFITVISELIPDKSHAIDWSFYALVSFLVRDQLQEHYNKNEPIGLKLGTVMTFFFGFLYFQYHFYKIAKAKSQHQQIQLPISEGTS